MKMNGSSDRHEQETGHRGAAQDRIDFTVAESARTDEINSQYAAMVESAFDGVITASLDGIIHTWNPACERIFGYACEDVIGRSLRELAPPDRAHEQVSAFQRLAAGATVNLETQRVRRDGAVIDVLLNLAPIRDPQGHIEAFVATVYDVSDRHRAPEQEMKEKNRAQAILLQLQKIEATGHLAIGIAHDLNNMLAVISGSIGSLKRRLKPEDSDLKRLSENAMNGVERAAALTRQLLAFARPQPLDEKSLDVNALVLGIKELLGRTLGEKVAIATTLSDGLWPVFADANQLENALLNLAVNARDAVPRGGRLTMKTANAALDEADAAATADVLAGEYVAITITDAGVGMTPEVVAQAFEPFFTTKGAGRGSGLGLSQVYGFVKQSGGHVTLLSAPGAGTAVTLYLPRVSASPAASPDIC